MYIHEGETEERYIRRKKQNAFCFISVFTVFASVKSEVLLIDITAIQKVSISYKSLYVLRIDFVFIASIYSVTN